MGRENEDGCGAQIFYLIVFFLICALLLLIF